MWILLSYVLLFIVCPQRSQINLHYGQLQSQASFLNSYEEAEQVPASDGTPVLQQRVFRDTPDNGVNTRSMIAAPSSTRIQYTVVGMKSSLSVANIGRALPCAEALGLPDETVNELKQGMDKTNSLVVMVLNCFFSFAIPYPFVLTFALQEVLGRVRHHLAPILEEAALRAQYTQIAKVLLMHCAVATGSVTAARKCRTGAGTY